MPTHSGVHSRPDQTCTPTRLAQPQPTSRVKVHIEDRHVRTATLATAAVPLCVLSTARVPPRARVRLRAFGSADSHRRRWPDRPTSRPCAPLAVRLAASTCRRRAAPCTAALGARKRRRRQLLATTSSTRSRAHRVRHVCAGMRAARAAGRGELHRAVARSAARRASTAHVRANDGQDLEELAAPPLLLELGLTLRHFFPGSLPRSPPSSSSPFGRTRRHSSSSTASTRWSIVSPRSLRAGGIVVRQCRASRRGSMPMHRSSRLCRW